jgi:hypothetical protein
MRKRPFTRGTALLSAFVLSGCYTYVPVTSAPVGSPVRVLLPVETRAPNGAVTRGTTPVEGTLVTFGDSILVATESTQQVGNFRQVSLQDTLRVAANEVDRIELRQFSRGRTAALTTAVVGGAVLAAAGVIQAVGGSDENGGNGNGTAASVTVGRLLKLFRSLGGWD